MKSRDYSLDFFRGIAALWIILIHTCFWSGGLYLPEYVRSLSLIIDVPLFMFISGASFNFSNSILKTLKGIVKIWYKYLIFLILYFIIIYIIDRDYFTLNNILNSMFFRFSINKLEVLPGSLWFIFMYFFVSVFGSIIIFVYNKYFKTLENFKFILLFLFVIYGMSVFNSGFMIINTNYLLHLLFYCLGYYLYNCKINIKQTLIFLALNLVVFFLILKTNVYDFNGMQLAKTHCHLLYFVYSVFSVIIVSYLKDRIKIGARNVFVFIGKNALLFYFCQGIGASLIYYLFDYINMLPKIIILLIMYFTNLIITLSGVYIVKFLQVVVDKIIICVKNIRGIKNEI